MWIICTNCPNIRYGANSLFSPLFITFYSAVTTSELHKKFRTIQACSSISLNEVVNGGDESKAVPSCYELQPRPHSPHFSSDRFSDKLQVLQNKSVKAPGNGTDGKRQRESTQRSAVHLNECVTKQNRRTNGTREWKWLLTFKSYCAILLFWQWHLLKISLLQNTGFDRYRHFNL